GAMPQSQPCASQLVGMQPHTLSTPPPPQLCGTMQPPQCKVAPQLSEMSPQFLPCAAQVVGLQPHTLATPPPPQLCDESHSPPQGLGAAQLPQLTVASQPLETAPQFLPCSAQLLGRQMPLPRSGSASGR